MVKLSDNILIRCEEQFKTKKITVNNLVFCERAENSKINVLGEYQTYEIKQIEIEISTEGMFNSSKNVLTVRELLTEGKHLRKLISKLE